jgi:hypothetical protein
MVRIYWTNEIKIAHMTTCWGTKCRCLICDQISIIQLNDLEVDGGDVTILWGNIWCLSFPTIIMSDMVTNDI